MAIAPAKVIIPVVLLAIGDNHSVTCAWGNAKLFLDLAEEKGLLKSCAYKRDCLKQLTLKDNIVARVFR
ncbi:hypothetical protein C9993_13025 [Marinobacter sp. Z-F4-2]|nr:hypothetical protein C9993_13025 [Marinobacter sp. Z-F4-2]